jgi:hypothetical protein
MTEEERGQLTIKQLNKQITAELGESVGKHTATIKETIMSLLK